MSDLAHLRRYAPLVEDLDAFLAASARPLPRVVWSPDEADEAALLEEIEAEPVAWRPRTWRLPTEAKPGRLRAFRLGRLHTQEEAALLAGDALGARPGERVLDLCAAPGGKTAQLAVAMADRGTLVANDRSIGRLSALRRTLDRLGVTCAAVTNHDGRDYPVESGWFDRVLVDAPCTCEGTSRKKAAGRVRAPGESYRRAVVGRQTALLREALRLTRRGGVVLYATCTYAPEENEGVLDAMDPALAAIEPIEAAAPPSTAGTTEWAGRALRPDVRHARRLWPHLSDTGGFFVARLRRV